MAPKKNTITVKFPTFEELIKMKEFTGIDSGNSPENIYVSVESTKDNDCFSFTVDGLGKTMVLIKTDDGGYSDGKGFEIVASEVKLFHQIVKVLSGTPVDPPIDIEGDLLTYDKESKVFECGCKRIDLKQADEVFRFIGGILGYTIT